MTARTTIHAMAYIDILQEIGRAREKLERHAGSWESTREVRRARVKLGEHGGSWESTREV